MPSRPPEALAYRSGSADVAAAQARPSPAIREFLAAAVAAGVAFLATDSILQATHLGADRTQAILVRELAVLIGLLLALAGVRLGITSTSARPRPVWAGVVLGTALAAGAVLAAGAWVFWASHR